ncbi:DNA polymerase III subunit gamma and tau [Streptomyces sp. MNU89]|uniref:DNA polymerase III subunit gamma and tau n=1 Tax=Streptomyces sp. MNU89 TaxID=2560025 RepID=UPI001E5697F0|nr:DNA polymerase III subunit gamma and tau [Streptomyces sp. MNU89]MCC9740356.1 DNA polymerase III subunit gamma and tau [Streptomyces sp. MNU89]
MSSLALYRRYRPETFAEVIGQSHVTDPLQQALRNNRVNHAYLFSGPRGCGKTTSARILARCLNCEQGPTPRPCGACPSCRDLARNGPGSIDVIEIDAASHGGVDDARDLREKAFFGPASSRYKIYIIDEAHMVTPAGFNALLKVVEEPPEHLKFIFATTEPEKVIGTIRSRTHHYPFRLVPPGTLRDYLAEVCEREAIPVEEGVLPLVVRAGAGSVRDSMSVMDQLLAGAAEDGVTYAMATALLGYTDSSLLDAIVDAFAAGDGSAAFEITDRVIEGGNDPRRFVADLLERLRDLVILAAVPDAADKGLIDAPADVLDRRRAQAERFGAAELSRAADLVNTGLIEMRGATSPRLQLELICARVLLPAAFDDERSFQARLDRLERGALAGGAAMGAGASAGQVPGPGPDAYAAPAGGPSGPAGPAAARAALPNRAAQQPPAPGQEPTAPAAQGPPPVSPGAGGPGQGQGRATAPGGAPGQQGGATPAGPGAGPGGWPSGAAPAAAPPAASAPGTGAGLGAGEERRPAGARPGQGGGSAEGGQRPGGRPGAGAGGPGAAQGGAQSAAPGTAGAEGAGHRPGGWPTAAALGQGSRGGAAGPGGAGAPGPQQPAPAPDAAASAPAPGSAQGAAQVRQMWPDILEAVKNRRRFTWILLSQNAHVMGFDGTTLQIGFSNAGARDSFVSGGSEDVLRQALAESLHVQWKIESVVDTTGAAGRFGPARLRAGLGLRRRKRLRRRERRRWRRRFRGGAPSAPRQSAPAQPSAAPAPAADPGSPVAAPAQPRSRPEATAPVPPSPRASRGAPRWPRRTTCRPPTTPTSTIRPSPGTS